METVGRLVAALIGRRVGLPEPVLAQHPELRVLRLRRGGVLPRLGGWALGQATVDAVTLRRTVFVAPHTRLEAGLLLHELRHVEQFFESRIFPLRYLWESLRHGYEANRYEKDARRYAAHRLATGAPRTSSERV